MTSPECCPGTLTNNGGKGEVCPAFGNPVPKHPTGTPLAAQTLAGARGYLAIMD